MATTFRQILDSYNANTLRTIAEANGIDPRKETGSGFLPKSMLVHKLTTQLVVSSQVMGSYNSLSPAEQEIIERILRHPTPISTSGIKRELLRAKLVTEAKMDESRYNYYRSHYEASPHNRGNAFEDVIARLTHKGLVFSTGLVPGGGQKFKWSPGTNLVIPIATRRVLPKPRPLLQPLEDWHPVEHFQSDPSILLRDLFLYWSAIRKKPMRLLKSGMMGKRGLKDLNEALLNSAEPDTLGKEADHFYLYWLRQILESQNLLKNKDGSLVAQDGKFWQQPLNKQIAACLDAWSKSQTLIEVADAKKEQATFVRARRVLINGLAELTQGWFDFDAVCEHVQKKDNNMLFARTNLEEQRSYYSYDLDKKKRQLRRYDELEASFLRTVIRSVLKQLGIVELGVGDWKGAPIEAVKLTDFGRNVLKKKSADWPKSDHGKIVVQPSFQILAMGSVSISALAQLEQIAERVAVDPNVFEYRLTRDSIYDALQNDLSANQIISSLTEQTGVPLPQNVRRSIQEWGSRHERIVFRSNVTLMQVASPDLWEKVQAQQTTKKLIARQIGDSLALVKRGKQQALVAGLAEIGIFPAVGKADVASTNHSVTIGEDGSLTPIHAVPSLLLTGRLAKIAQQEAAVWRLTEQSVGAVAGDKPKVEALLKELSSLASGKLPDALVALVKQWGGYYGQVSAETLTLIEFQDKTTLEQMCQNPDLAPHLTRFPAGNRALGVVTKGKLKVVKQTLTQLGVRVHNKLPR